MSKDAISIPIEQGEDVNETKIDETESEETAEDESKCYEPTLNVFSDVRFTLYHTFQVLSEDKEPWIRHIEVLSNGNILLADRYNQQLILYHNNGIRIKHVKLSSGPWNLTITNNNLAAITIPDNKAVAFVSTDNLKGTHKINIHDDCRGIACVNNKLVVNCVINGLKVLTMNGRTLKVFPQYVGYMSLSKGPNDSLLCSVFATGRVFCMDLKGNVKYDFTNQNKLNGPCSFTFDIVHEYLYVVGHQDNYIHMIGEKGEKTRVLFTKKDGIDRPWAVAYDFRSKRLYISNFGGKNISVWRIVQEV